MAPRLWTRHACAEYQHARGGMSARRGHEHRQHTARGGSRDQHRLVTRDGGLRRQHIHRLRPRDAREQHQRERGQFALRQLSHEIRDRLEEGDEDASFRDQGEGLGIWRLYLEDDVRLLEYRVPSPQPYARLFIRLVREIGGGPGSPLDGDLKSALDQTSRDVGRKSDAPLIRGCFLRYSDFHGNQEPGAGSGGRGFLAPGSRLRC